MNYIPLYVILPLLAGVIIPIVGRKVKFIPALLTNLVLLFLTILTVLFILKGDFFMVYKVGGWGIIKGIPVGIFLVVDALSRLVLLIVNLIGLCAGLYSISYIKKFTGEEKYFALFSLMIAGMNGVVISGDLFNIFVFLEIAAIASYALVAFGIRKEELEASFKYQVLGGISSMMILLGIGITYWAFSTLNIADVSSLLRSRNPGRIVFFIQALFLMGFGLKAALVPFHSWLPDAHSSAPSPISAMLSGVLIKAIGMYVILRLFFNMFPVSYKTSLIITLIGALSMIIGVFLAIGQWDIKRLLAYHSISQMGYVVTGIGAGLLLISKGQDLSLAAFAILGGIFHLYNHAIFKGLLFLTAGSVEHRTGLRDMRQIGGLGQKMHLTTTSSLAASMAIAGIPPFNGFFSKLIIIIALLKAHYYMLSFFAVLVSVITLSSFLKLQRYTFFEKLKQDWQQIKESPFWMTSSMLFMAMLCLVTSALIIPGIRERFLSPAVKALMELGRYSLNVLGQ
ncbi:MAG: NADH/ubiquinone/plastoquinone (complex I) [Spirochaetes bacterium]|nr:NADH/ubiquinone/plastoquinone (complex I) [Spirochaetota bacterium]